jgi:hypothetical protein
MKILIILFGLAVAAMQKPAGPPVRPELRHWPLTFTGSDGTVCTLQKVAGAVITARLNCTDGSTAIYTTITGTGTAPAGGTVGLGQVIALIGINPTAAPVTMGALGAVPANGIAWSFATGSGNPVSSGAVGWP